MSVTRSADGRCPGLGLALAVIATAQLMVVLRTALPLRVGATVSCASRGCEGAS
jgi:hypothetical protein